MKDYSHLKKGIQYSHYCGRELMELCCSIDNAKYNIENSKDAIEDFKYAQSLVQELRDKIAALDHLNKMNY
jgi:hypothetical protein